MRSLVVILGLLFLGGGPPLRAEEDFLPPNGPGPEEGFAPDAGGMPTPRRGSRRRHGDILFRQFRREVREIGEETRDNLELIRMLEERIPALDPGPERAGLEERLAVLRRRQAELRLELARKKVAFTLRALEVAEERYRKALAGLEKVRGVVEAEYPDLATLPPVE